MDGGYAWVWRRAAALLSVGATMLVACGEDVEGVDVDGEVDVASTASPDALPTVNFDVDGRDTTAPDAQTTETIDPGDATDPGDASECFTFGCPCQGNADCLDGLCVEGVDGRVCTRTCVTACPDGWDCVTGGAGGPDGVSVCVPRHVRLCRPCRAHADCQAASDPSPAYCLPAEDPDEGSFCGSGCANRPCPEGYVCESVALADGGTARQCVPEAGMCTCRPAWADLGLTTACARTNAHGACDGTRTCGPQGLTSCDAPAARPEQCNGADDDCNGTVDDIEPSPCDLVNNFGACEGTWGCTADGIACEGAPAAAEACNGVDDDCDGQTDELSCDDGLWCTADACASPFDCEHTLQAGACLIDGACHQGMSTDPDNACQVCDPSQTTSRWSVAQNTCTIGGTCYPANAVNPDSPCLVCDPARSTNQWSQAFNTCNIQGECVAAGFTQPGAPCLACDPLQNAAGWTALGADTPCDDGDPCSEDARCDGGGVCVGDTSCDDGVVCTTNVCTAAGCDNSGVTAGWCRIDGACYAQGTSNPDNVCERCAPSTSRTSWSPSPASVACSDGNPCTQGDACDGQGSCAPGPGCSDGLSCTTDTCTAFGCFYPTSPGRCRINDQCYSDGDTRPGDVCEVCDAGASQSSWSLNDGVSCNDGNGCTSNDRCGGGTCGGTPNTDGFEPNNSRPAGYDLGSISDSDGWADARSFTANLYPTGDVDWYRYRVTDPSNARDPNPGVALSGIPSGRDYDLCAYWSCDDPGDGQSVDCDKGSASSWAGLPGCCSRRSGSADELVHLTPECPNSGAFGADDDTGTVYVRVYRASGSWTCGNYTLKWGDGNCGPLDSASQCP